MVVCCGGDGLDCMDWIVWIGLYGLDGCADVCAVSVSVLVSDQTQTIVIIFYFLQPPTLH
jgi:hypothetical protein